MKNFRTISGCLLLFMISLCIPAPGEAACDANDEKRWEKLRDQLPTSDVFNIAIIIDDLTKLKDKCDPKTRFSTSVVRLLIAANFRQDELGGGQRRLNKYYSRFPIRR